MGEVTCQSCGNMVRDTAKFCTRCGGVVGAWTPPSAVDSGPSPSAYQQQPHFQDPYQQPYNQSYPSPQYQQPYQQPAVQQNFYGQPMMAYPEPKDKTAAILLAVFLGFWTWVYTYKKDAWKFWLSLGLHLTLLNPLWTWLLLFLPNIGLHVWAIIDVASKPQQYYDHYPNG